MTFLVANRFNPGRQDANWKVKTRTTQWVWKRASAFQKYHRAKQPITRFVCLKGQILRPLKYLSILYYQATLQRLFVQRIVSDLVVSKDLNFSIRDFDIKMTISQIGQPFNFV